MTNVEILEQIERTHKDALRMVGTYSNSAVYYYTETLKELTYILEVKRGFSIAEAAQQVRLAHYKVLADKLGAGRYLEENLIAQFEISLKNLRKYYE